MKRIPGRENSSKTLSWESAWLVWRMARRLLWLKQNIPVKNSSRWGKRDIIVMKVTERFGDFYPKRWWCLCLFSITALMWYNSHTMKFTLLKYTSQWFTIYSEWCYHHHDLTPEYFHHLQKNPYILVVAPYFSLPLGPGNYNFTFCLYGIGYSRYCK